MEQSTLEARAQDRAYHQHVHIFAVQGRPGVYVTKSKTDPAERYNLVVNGDTVACSCKGFYYRQSCKHVEALKGRLARERVLRRRLAIRQNRQLKKQLAQEVA